MAILVHVCCAECLLGPLDELRERGFVGYFHNPNIHPLIEFRRRQKAIRVLAEQLHLDCMVDGSYGLWDFLDRVDYRGDQRCRQCYALRLARAAEVALERGMEAFTTTLLVSRHQKHELVREVGRQIAGETGMPFAYYDWRHLAEAGHQEAKRRNLYRQQYCGCLFSEYDRYKDTGLYLYHEAGEADQRG